MFVFLKSRRQHTEKKRKLKYQKTELIQCGGVDKKKPNNNWKLWHQLLRDARKPTTTAALTVDFRTVAANSSVKGGLLFPFTFKKSETRKLENRWEENWKGKEMKWRKESFTDTEHWTHTQHRAHYYLPRLPSFAPSFYCIAKTIIIIIIRVTVVVVVGQTKPPFFLPFCLSVTWFFVKFEGKEMRRGQISKRVN